MINFNWKNTAENLGLIIVGILVGVGIGHVITKVTTKSLLADLKPTIDKAIDKETISNTISNAIDLKIDKIKKSDTLQINVNQEPFNDLKPVSSINKIEDCAISKTDFNKLSASKQNRLKRWLSD